MGVELLGIVASFATIVSGFGWLMERSAKRSERMFLETHAAITKVESNVDSMEKAFQDLRVLLPTNFVTKQELLQHIQGEEIWHNTTSERLRQIQEELLALRYHSNNNGHH
jgi:hypothetical protein